MCLSRESWLCVVCAYWRAAVWWTIEEQQIFNHFIYTSFKGFLCNTRIWVYVGFCRWIHFKMMKLHPESWTFICLLFSCWHWSFFFRCWCWVALSPKLLQRITVRRITVTLSLKLGCCQTSWQLSVVFQLRSC